jgi:hypothetical protein
MDVRLDFAPESAVAELGWPGVGERDYVYFRFSFGFEPGMSWQDARECWPDIEAAIRTAWEHPGVEHRPRSLDVITPVPTELLRDAEFDVIGEIIPQAKNAVLHALGDPRLAGWAEEEGA